MGIPYQCFSDRELCHWNTCKPDTVLTWKGPNTSIVEALCMCQSRG